MFLWPDLAPPPEAVHLKRIYANIDYCSSPVIQTASLDGSPDPFKRLEKSVERRLRTTNSLRAQSRLSLIHRPSHLPVRHGLTSTDQALHRSQSENVAVKMLRRRLHIPRKPLCTGIRPTPSMTMHSNSATPFITEATESNSFLVEPPPPVHLEDGSVIQGLLSSIHPTCGRIPLFTDVDSSSSRTATEPDNHVNFVRSFPRRATSTNSIPRRTNKAITSSKRICSLPHTTARTGRIIDESRGGRTSRCTPAQCYPNSTIDSNSEKYDVEPIPVALQAVAMERVRQRLRFARECLEQKKRQQDTQLENRRLYYETLKLQLVHRTRERIRTYARRQNELLGQQQLQDQRKQEELSRRREISEEHRRLVLYRLQERERKRKLWLAKELELSSRNSSTAKVSLTRELVEKDRTKPMHILDDVTFAWNEIPEPHHVQQEVWLLFAHTNTGPKF